MLSSISSTPSHFFMSCRYFFWMSTPSSGRRAARSSWVKETRANWWPLRPQTSIRPLPQGFMYRQVMASVASSSLMQKTKRSSTSCRKSPDQVTGDSAGNSEKFWNHSAPLTGSVYVRRPCSSSRLPVLSSSVSWSTPAGSWRTRSTKARPCTPMRPGCFTSAG